MVKREVIISLLFNGKVLDRKMRLQLEFDERKLEEGDPTYYINEVCRQAYNDLPGSEIFTFNRFEALSRGEKFPF